MKKSYKSILVFGILSSFFILFNSCQNFLQGNQLAKAIEEEIEWASIKDPLKVVTSAPSFNSLGVTEDSPIEIKFNKSINPETFNYEISGNGENLNKYFKAPQFYSNNKVVKFFRNTDFEFGLKSGEVIDITVTIDKNLQAQDKTKFSRTDYLFEFRINGTKDNLPPSVEHLKLFKNPYNLNETELTTKAFDEWEESDYSINHINSYIVDCVVRDSGTGPAGILVKEEYICDTAGNFSEFEHVKSKIHLLNFESDPTDSVLFKIHEKLNFETYDDGIIKLTLQVVDQNENASEDKSVYYVLKDTYFEIKLGEKNSPYNPIELANMQFEAINEDSLDVSKLDAENTMQVYFKGYICDEFFSGITSSPDNMYAKFETGSSKDSFTYSTTKFTSNTTETYTILYSDVTYENLDTMNYLKVSIYDEAGNVWSKTQIIPRRTQLYSGSNITSAKDYFENVSSSKINIYYLYEYDNEKINPDKDLYTKVTSYPEYFNPFGWPAPVSEKKAKKMYVYYEASYELDSLGAWIYAPISKRYVFNYEDYKTDDDGYGDDYEEIEGVDFDFSYKYENNLLKVTVSDPEANNFYDCYYLNIKIGEYGSSYKYLMNKNNNTYYFERSLYDSWLSEDITLTVTGIKDGQEVYQNKQIKKARFNKYSGIESSIVESYESINISYSLKGINFNRKSGTNYKVYYQKDSPILLENIDKVSFYETTGSEEIPSYVLDDGIYYFRIETLPASTPRIVTQNVRYEIYHKFDYKASISTDDVEKSLYYLQYQPAPQHSGLPPAYNSTDQYCTYNASWTNNLASSNGLSFDVEKHWNFGRKKGATNQTKFKPFEIVFTNTKTKEKVITPFDMQTRIFNGTEWSSEYIETYDRNPWTNKENRFIVNHGRDQLSVAVNAVYMNTIYWDGNWVKVYLNNSSKEKSIVSSPTYIYLDNLTSTPEYPKAGKIKNLMDNGYMVTLFCDSPTFVHTIYADRDLGSLENWEAKGISVNPKVYYESSNVDVDTSEIPADYYYVTIAWFMDGTNTITPVHKKTSD